MDQNLKQSLAHVLWVGGGTDTGKTTVARNIIRRDMLLAEHVRTEAERRGLRVIEVDGSLLAEELADFVDRHFEPFYAQLLGRGSG